MRLQYFFYLFTYIFFFIYTLNKRLRRHNILKNKKHLFARKEREGKVDFLTRVKTVYNKRHWCIMGTGPKSLHLSSWPIAIFYKERLTIKILEMAYSTYFTYSNTNCSFFSVFKSWVVSLKNKHLKNKKPITELVKLIQP